MGKGFIHCACQVHLDPQKVVGRVKSDVDDALRIMGEKALADANRYVKQTEAATLLKSGRFEVENNSLELIWDTPYARRQYLTIQTAYKRPNPNARWRWAEYAQQRHGKEWLAAFQKRLGVKD